MKNVSEFELGRLFHSLSELLSKVYIARGLVANVTDSAPAEQLLEDNVGELAALVADSVDDVADRLDRLNEILEGFNNP
jgi:hypothetical protein